MCNGFSGFLHKNKVRDQAQAEYYKVRVPAWEQYNKVRAQAWTVMIKNLSEAERE